MNSGGERIGFLFGAGASFQLGMPLVTHLTALFRVFCEFQLPRIWEDKRRRGDNPDATVLAKALQALARPDMHYEAVLGMLRTEGQRLGQSNALLQQYDGLYQRMVEAVYFILLDRQLEMTSLLSRALPAFDGIARFARRSAPLHVFSLNHDLMLEIIGNRLGLAVRD